jgi:hypothetical protein
MKRDINVKKDINKFLDDGKYLPPVMRDFHFQKDLFKTISELDTSKCTVKLPTWMEAAVYVIDIFLWFMARRGYTLQKSRARCDFRDLQEDVSKATEKRLKSEWAILAREMEKIKEKNNFRHHEYKRSEIT